MVEVLKSLVLLEVRVERMSVLLVPLHNKDLATASLDQPLDIHFDLLSISYDAVLIDSVLAKLFTAIHWPVHVILHYQVLELLQLVRKSWVKVTSILF